MIPRKYMRERKKNMMVPKEQHPRLTSTHTHMYIHTHTPEPVHTHMHPNTHIKVDTQGKEMNGSLILFQSQSDAIRQQVLRGMLFAKISRDSEGTF